MGRNTPDVAAPVTLVACLLTLAITSAPRYARSGGLSQSQYASRQTADRYRFRSREPDARGASIGRRGNFQRRRARGRGVFHRPRKTASASSRCRRPHRRRARSATAIAKTDVLLCDAAPSREFATWPSSSNEQDLKRARFKWRCHRDLLIEDAEISGYCMLLPMSSGDYHDYEFGPEPPVSSSLT